MSSDFNDTRPLETASTSWDGAQFASGDIIAGRYKVLSLLGKGGMGLVYRVEQLIGGKELALKTIHQSFLSESTVKRFEHEARATFAVSHANIIAVKAFGLLDDRTPFLAMEIVEGQTLAELLQDSGPLPIGAALPIIIQVCYGLAHAHENAVVHRDIKPSNIMILKGRPIGSAGSVKILDFGIAKFSHREGGEIQALTKTGELFGSPLYMSPEQCDGGNVDQRSDVYSLGCVIFETLTGRAPFVGRNAMATLMMHQTNDPPTLTETAKNADFPADLEHIVAKMLAKQPEDRYQDLGLVADDLAAIVNRTGSATVPLSTSQSVAEQSSSLRIQPHNKRNIFFAIAAVAILSVGAVAIFKPSPEVRKVVFHPTDTPNLNREELEKARAADEKKVEQTVALNEVAPAQLKAQLAATGNNFELRHHLVTAKMLEIIGSAKHLSNVNLLGCKIDNDNLDKLSQLPLTNITLNNTNFDDSGAKKLAQVQSLRVIKANFTPISNKGLAYLKKLPKLTHLKIEGSNVDIDGARDICKKTTLTQLALADCPKITEVDQKLLVKEFPKIDFVFKGKFDFSM
ncbi:MAG: protein kinase [Candidatus Obscuribacterales bacterium]|jgi:serine/threonine protein kinase